MVAGEAVKVNHRVSALDVSIWYTKYQHVNDKGSKDLVTYIWPDRRHMPLYVHRLYMPLHICQGRTG